MKRRAVSIILSLTLIVTAVFSANMFEAFAAASGEWSATGTGNSVKWSYDEDTTTLTISGIGKMKDCGEIAIGFAKNQAPWKDYKSNITKIVVEEGITEIGEYCFYNCTALKTVVLPSTLVVIGGSGTYDLTGNTDVTRGAFRDCTALESIILPNNLKTIEKHAFSGCTSLKSVTFPDSLTSLGDFAFRDCTSLTTVRYGTGMTSTGKYAFYKSGVKYVEFSPTITSIDQYTFFNTQITAIEIPEQIESIGMRAFANCTFISDVTIYNANCEFGGIQVLNSGEDPFNGSNQSLTMYGHSGSTAETYANEKNYKFVSIDSCSHEVTHEVIIKNATCTEKGRTSWVCDACGHVKAEADIDAIGHDWELANTVDESQTNGHIYTYYLCTICNEEKCIINHVDFIDGFYEYSRTGNCRIAYEVYTCLVDGCGEVKRNPIIGNHQVENYTVTLEPTCTEKGSKEGVCTVCGQTVTENIAETGHINVLIENLDSTSEDGHTYEVYKCSVCGAETSIPTHASVDGEDIWIENYYTSTVLIKPGCVIDGQQLDICIICDKRRLVTLKANGQHDWYETSRTEPACTSVGKIYYACRNCDMTKSDNIEALGHDLILQEDKSTSAACTTAGNKYYICSRAGCSYVQNDIISPLGHSSDEENYTIINPASCEEDGSAISVCDVCGAEYDIVLSKTGHNFEDEVKPIEDMPGHSMVTPVCTVCNYRNSGKRTHDEWLEGHYTTEVTIKGTCNIPETTTDTCEFCSEKRSYTGTAAGHKLSYTRTQNNGELVYTCSVCGDTITRNPITISSSFILYANKYSGNTALGYLYETTGDGFVNAKDYSIINKAVIKYRANQN
ncbi:MAG: leucine-rich repeat domain-containing protein [Acetobacter sp.]|nr:leucine-rich repeat domain-containing protein [Bacteroides sp.]MCM1340704.1 leucine-rich repeat domain-containing protein [Acetobacter sp.]MCM1433815.1 leucine-rich repeat domain-containing protein [Clostridiales bacterium]